MRISRLKTSSIIAVGLLFICSSSCKKNNECLETSLTQNNIQGSWKHYYKQQPVNLTYPNKYHFRFTGDSFYVEINEFSDILGDSLGNCQQINYFEYAKGKFTIENEQTIVLNGVFTNADYTIKTGGCYQSGAYNEKYDGHFCNDTLVLEWQKKGWYGDYKVSKMGKE